MPSSLAAGDVLGALIVAVAPLSGAGFGLIRGLASLRGSAVAAAAILTWGRRPVTGKLCHDPSIACPMRCGLPHRIQVVALTDDHGAPRRRQQPRSALPNRRS